MLLGSLLFGAMLGLLVSVGAVLLGLPVLQALVVYVVVGTLSMLLVMALFLGDRHAEDLSASDPIDVRPMPRQPAVRSSRALADR